MTNFTKLIRRFSVMGGGAFLLILSTLTVSAQNLRTVTGQVTDEEGNPLVGAVVSQPGTSNAAITDIAGDYSIRVTEGAQLNFSSMGYTPETITVGERSVVNISMTIDSTMIDDVVVVGYGIQKKANLTGSVSQIDSKALADRPIQNVSSALQGLMPGVTVISGQGRPGEDGSTIRVRGDGTLNNKNPYVLIDGMESGTMNSIDPNDIATISVLKDAASAAIYGSKASNGVILITTKRGQIGKPQVTYNGYVSIQNATNLIERLSSADYATMWNDLAGELGTEKRFSADDITKFRDGSDPEGHPNTDWYGLAYRTGVQHQHSVNLSGGTETVNYMASAGFLSQDGILPNSDLRKFNLRTNLEMKLSKRWTARLNLAYIHDNHSDANSSYYNGSSDQIIRQLNVMAPWIPYKYKDAEGNEWYGTISDGAPMAWLDSGMTVDREKQNITALFAVDYKIIDGLVATVQGSYSSYVEHYRDFRKFIQYEANKASQPNQLDERYYLNNRTNFDILLNYDRSFGLHNVKGLAGWHTEKYKYIENIMSRETFPNNELTDLNAGAVASQKNSGYTRELAMVSWFGRVNYDYAGKYLFEANIRGDASSRFAPANRWGYFPSFSAAWRLSEEGFMDGTRGWLTDLKIRGSWGLLGNQDALDDYYPYLNTYNLGAPYGFGGALNTGYYQSAYKKEAISWEKARTWGLGLDLSLIGKIDISLDYYDRKTTGILMDVPVPSEFGLGAYKDNVGSMVNRGVELNVGYRDRWGDWSLAVNGNVAYNKNTILELGGVDGMTDPDNGNRRRQKRYALGSHYMYEADGFFATDAEAKAWTEKYAVNIVNGVATAKDGYPFSIAYYKDKGFYGFKGGDIRYKDANGDGKITADDRVYCNAVTPRYTFGLNLNAGWKNIDLSMIWTGQAGAARIFSAEAYGDFRGDSSHPSTIWKDSWTYNKSNPKMPAVMDGINSNSHPQTVMSTFWLQNTAFVRLKNLQLGYTFPARWMERAGISRLRVYYSTENLLTFDSMPINLDPEATSERASNYSLLKSHSFGVNLTF